MTHRYHLLLACAIAMTLLLLRQPQLVSIRDATQEPQLVVGAHAGRRPPLQTVHVAGVSTPTALGPLQAMFERTAGSRRATRPSAAAVVVMVANAGQGILLQNFACQADRLGFDWKNSTLLYTLDNRTSRWAAHFGVPHHQPENVSLPRAAAVFSDAQFKATVFWKSAAVHDALQMEIPNVLYQDIDVVWREDPRVWFAAADPSVDMFWSYDGGSRQQQPLYVNSGFIYIRNTARSRAFWREMFLNAHLHSTQQGLAETVLTHHIFNNDLRIAVLDDRFANGHLLGLTSHKVPADYIVAHASWTYNMTNKIPKLRQLGMWAPGCLSGPAAF